jgi:hypothetical protein
MIMKPFQLLVSILAAVSLQAGPMPDAEFIDNGVIRLGIDRSAGGSIFHFGPSGEGSQNLLNHFDKGRFIQQSYYGRVDGSEWAGKPWRWNPVQGGGYRGEAAEEVVTERDGETLRVVSKPRHWATGERVDEAEMQSVITLRGPVAEIEFLFRYKGDEDHPLQHQELPAVFVDAEYSNLVYVAEGVLQRKVPGWPNERIDAEESWAAYLNDADEGIGVLFPETTEVTCYRYEGDGKTGPTGSACSYFAPVRTFAVTPDLEFGYKVYLTTGSLEEIRERFGKIAGEGKGE